MLKGISFVKSRKKSKNVNKLSNNVRLRTKSKKRSRKVLFHQTDELFRFYELLYSDKLLNHRKEINGTFSYIWKNKDTSLASFGMNPKYEFDLSNNIIKMVSFTTSRITHSYEIFKKMDIRSVMNAIFDRVDIGIRIKDDFKSEIGLFSLTLFINMAILIITFTKEKQYFFSLHPKGREIINNINKGFQNKELSVQLMKIFIGAYICGVGPSDILSTFNMGKLEIDYSNPVYNYSFVLIKDTHSYLSENELSQYIKSMYSDIIIMISNVQNYIRANPNSTVLFKDPRDFIESETSDNFNEIDSYVRKLVNMVVINLIVPFVILNLDKTVNIIYKKIDSYQTKESSNKPLSPPKTKKKKRSKMGRKSKRRRKSRR